MSKLYTVTLYYNTKFGVGNIPDSPARLSGFDNKAFDAVLLRQDYATASVKLNAKWEDVRGADYAKMTSDDGDLYYILPTPPVMLSDSTAEIYLTLDPLTSIGGIEGLEIVTGWAHRAHADDDAPFSNILPEPWAPMNQMIIRGNDTFHASDGEQETLNIVIATCDLRAGKKYEAVVIQAALAGETGEAGEIIIPVTPTVDQSIPGAINSTELWMPAGPGEATVTYKYKLPGMWAFLIGEGDVQAGIEAVRNLGLDGSLISAYVVPKEDVTAQTDQQGLIAILQGHAEQATPDQPYVYAEVKNNKAISLYNIYSITSIASGNSAEYNASELHQGDDSRPTWNIYSDPSPDGTTYCAPLYFEKSLTKIYEHAICGMPWITSGISFVRSSGGALGVANAARKNSYAMLDYNHASERRQLDAAQSAASLGVAAATSIASLAMGAAAGEFLAPYKGAVNSLRMGNEAGRRAVMLGEARETADAAMSAAPTGIISQASSYIMAGQRRRLESRQASENLQRTVSDNLFSASAAANIAPPQLAFPVSVTAASYVGNAFTVIHATLSDNDVKRFDDFLSAYGYAVDEKLTAAMLSSRANHNYIKTSNAQVYKAGYPTWLLELVAAAFDGGVRVWHTTPTNAALYDNPKKG